MGVEKVNEVVMEFSSLFIAGLACALIVMTSKWWDLKQENEFLCAPSVQQDNNVQKEVVKETNVNTNSSIGTRDLFLNILTKIGCQYELGEGDDHSDGERNIQRAWQTILLFG